MMRFIRVWLTKAPVSSIKCIMANDAIHKSMGELAEVRPGHPFRGAIVEVPDGDVRVVQIGDLARDGLHSRGDLTRTTVEGRKAPDWLRDQDVLLVARGAHSYAVCLSDPPPRTVCSPHLYVIRVKRTDRLLPAFLAWQLNQVPAQRLLRQSAEGSHQLSIRRTVLEDLPISLLPLEQQQRVIDMDTTARQERQLLTQLIENREAQLAAIAERLLGFKDGIQQ